MATKQQLANAIFDYVEAFYNPHRRHSKIGIAQTVSHVVVIRFCCVGSGCAA
ncbi:IS3 family transposase [Nocardia jiangxiensis]|uniref:IS3 family transposase n=1 Tax=Nocardia jiangxiensis TaxID=282685 RepID=A0ABW6SHM8_9NOCA